YIAEEGGNPNQRPTNSDRLWLFVSLNTHDAKAVVFGFPPSFAINASCGSYRSVVGMTAYGGYAKQIRRSA
ncbi:MAG: hypothetical protein LBQ52_07850, partial [Helicobacteraceae bacterium]|nr:hypothetical protein [Helicobacteraceae bacterium]